METNPIEFPFLQHDLVTWERDGAEEAGEYRSLAIQHIVNSYNNRSNCLCLTNLNLTTLPAKIPSFASILFLSGNKLRNLHQLSPFLVCIDVSNNQLKNLPNCLPPLLEILKVSNNRLKFLPENLPSSLVTLDVSGNKISILPKSLPSYIQILNVSNNRLIALPEKLPESLRQFYVSNNSLNLLPKNLPPEIEILFASKNYLNSLPENLPRCLQSLDVSVNNIRALPNNLPCAMQILNVAVNKIDALPNYLPCNLKICIISQNNLSFLPEILPSELCELYVSKNNLITLPYNLPHSLRILDASFNQIRLWPKNIPSSLICLQISENCLCDLPEILPTSLHKLDISNNNINNLPRELPDHLHELYAAKNNLSELPQSWSSGLRILDVTENYISVLPETLPDTLCELYVLHNNLSCLPVKLPSFLEILNISSNNLCTLSGSFPSSLKKLYASHNNLLYFPLNLPLEILEIDLSHNQLTQLPFCIEEFSAETTLIVENNPLTAITIDMIVSLINRQDDGISRIYFTQPLTDDNSVEIISLIVEVTKWLGYTDKRWNVISEEAGAESFAYFLSKLRMTINYDNAQFKEKVSIWLEQLAEQSDSTSALRMKVFLIAEEATQSCEDRVSLSFNHMKILGVANDVENGKYDNELPELIKIARSMFRLNILEEIARTMVKSLQHVDEIEVYLAYQVRLRDILALPVDTIDMRYSNVSGVTQNHVKLAADLVLSREKNEFLNYLSIDWEPWKEVLKRCDNDGYNKAISIVRDENNFNQQLDARKQEFFAETGLIEIDFYTENELGRQVQRNMEQKVWCELTQNFLERLELKLF